MSAGVRLIVTDSTGRITLGKELGRGGEGAVYEVAGRPEVVAKIYHKPITAEKALKIETMAALKSDRLLTVAAWPVDILKTNGSAPCGLLMPRMTGHKDIHRLYSPKSRKVEFPNADWRFLVHVAANTCRAFASIHEIGCVIGDVNHGGVTVSAQATVKLIDCDSFQVNASGRRFLCEVGVATFTPPELQNKPFKGVVRSPNHDAFGLAILIFHLLFMGRHPFAGRYRGSGDMPIERAIQEFRFAYAANSQTLLMEPPPATAPLSAAAAETAQLFERAFSRASVNDGGRPTAKEWLTALESLASRLKGCANNPSHFFFAGLSSCPWCGVEQASGVVLFNIYVRSAHSTFDIAAVWSRIEGIRPPGPLPQLKERSNFGPIVPSAAAQQLGTERRRQTMVGVIACTLLAALLCVLVPKAAVVWLVGGLICAGIVGALAQARASSRFRPAYTSAETRYRSLTEQWEKDGGDQLFLRKLRELEVVRNQWREVPNIRQVRYRELESSRQKQQLMHFLESFEIDSAQIDGIGPGRKATLESFNIDSAWDCTPQNLANVPGFGDTLTARLLNWRYALEQRFRFDPSQGVDPRDVAVLDREMTHSRQKLEDALIQGLTDLTQARNAIVARRSALEHEIENALGLLVHAEADMGAAAAFGAAGRGRVLSGLWIGSIAVVALGLFVYLKVPTVLREVPSFQKIQSPQPRLFSPTTIERTPVRAAAPPATLPIEIFYVKREWANLRQEPTMKAPVLRRLKKNAVVYVEGGSGEWRRVVKSAEDPRMVGWVHSSVVAAASPEVSERGH